MVEQSPETRRCVRAEPWLQTNGILPYCGMCSASLAPPRSSKVPVADMEGVGESQKPRSIVPVDWIQPRTVASKVSSSLGFHLFGSVSFHPLSPGLSLWCQCPPCFDREAFPAFWRFPLLCGSPASLWARVTWADVDVWFREGRSS